MKEIKLDDIDWKILSLLNNNSRITLVDIAEKVNGYWFPEVKTTGCEV